MMTRSGLTASTSSQSSYLSRKSLPAILTRSRKRKSSALQEEDLLSRLPPIGDRRNRLSLSNELNFPEALSTKEEIAQRQITSRRRSSRHSTPSETGSNVSRDYRRRLVDDYDLRSNTSSSSSSIVSSTVSSYSTRRSSRRSHSDQESVISGLSDQSGCERQTPNGIRDSRLSTFPVSESPENTVSRTCPLPSVCFADCEEIWDLMCKMDNKYKKAQNVFKDHPILSSQMRAILIDWIMDVCEAYHLHRETMYLAVDYLDRYLITQKEVDKSTLQLLGITCLFIASKLEEIYPPKLKTFAYVTDGASTESEILDMELVVMKTLKWKLTPITPAGWLNVYLQVLSYRSGGIYCTRSGSDFLRASIRTNRHAKPEDASLVKHLYDGIDFVKALRIVDLAIIDMYSLNYSYSTLAAAALYHLKGRHDTLSATGMKWTQLAPCINWMAPYASVLRRHANDIPPVLPSIDNIPDDARYLIQSHCVSLEMLEEADALRSTKICSPLNHTEGLVTPPNSGEKYRRPKH